MYRCNPDTAMYWMMAFLGFLGGLFVAFFAAPWFGCP